VIPGSRVRLRAMEKLDLPRFQEWLNDPEVTDGLATSLPISAADEEKWFADVTERQAEERPLSIDVRDGHEWKLVGNTVLFHLEWTSRSAEFGIFIGDKSEWNKGYGTEVLGLILKHAFETLNLNRVYLRVFATNPRARRSYEKAGFMLEGTLRQAMFRHGRYIDVHVMSILRSEWQALQEGK
jgi:diamine N-acetyltransferase